MPLLLWRAVTVWLSYSLLGWLAVACAGPGQQVAPLFLPAGLALAFLDVWGLWALLPIALGGFTVDMGTMWALHPERLTGSSWLGPVVCGAGAALQAWIGWRWVTGGLRAGLQLDTPLEIGLFLLKAGVVACCINAGLAVPTLMTLGWLPWASAPTAILSWWAGDLMGVALGTPLALTLIGRPRALWRARRWTVGLPLALATVLLGLAAFQVGQARHQQEDETFRLASEAMASQVKLRLGAYLDALADQEAVVSHAAMPRAEDFARHAEPWLARLPGADAVMWQANTSPTGADAAPRSAPITLMTPVRPRNPWQGWDVLAQAQTQEAWDRARREDQIIASAPFNWPGRAAPTPGIVLVKAVYRGQPFTPQARIQAHIGAVTLPLNLVPLTQALLADRPHYMAACLIDPAVGASIVWLGGDADCRNLSRQAMHRIGVPIEFGGRDWLLQTWNREPVPVVTSGLDSWVLTGVGVGFSAALGALLLVMTSHARYLKEARDEAQARREEAERANRAKSEFMSRMSHELRTPLNAVLGFAQVMEMDARDPLSTGQKARLAQIQQAGWNLLEMIDDVLDIARLDTGALRLQTEPIAVARELGTARRLFDDDARKAKVTLHAAETWPDSWYVMADAARLRQILGHLLSNAIKFNEAGGEIWLDAHDMQQAGLRQLRISVRDTGQGLDPNQMAQLFQPFNRVGREHGPTVGRGVGLAISRHLAHLMGGQLEASSGQGDGQQARGATFTLTLPLCPPPRTQDTPAPTAQTPPATAPTAKASTGQPRRVLYVEDNHANSEVLRAALADRPALQLTVADTTEAGLAAVHDRLRGGPPDLILLDVHLPDASGLELLGLLKANPDTARIPVIMISADALPEQVDAALAAGAACYVTKPVQLPALLAQMDELLPAA